MTQMADAGAGQREILSQLVDVLKESIDDAKPGERAPLVKQLRETVRELRVLGEAVPPEGSVVLELVGKFGGGPKSAAVGDAGRRARPRRSVGGHRAS